MCPGLSLLLESNVYRHLGRKCIKKSLNAVAVSIIETFVPQIALKVAGSEGADGADESGTLLSDPTSESSPIAVAVPLVSVAVVARRARSVGEEMGMDEWMSPRRFERGVLRCA